MQFSLILNLFITFCKQLFFPLKFEYPPLSNNISHSCHCESGFVDLWFSFLVPFCFATAPVSLKTTLKILLTRTYRVEHSRNLLNKAIPRCLLTWPLRIFVNEDVLIRVISCYLLSTSVKFHFFFNLLSSCGAVVIQKTFFWRFFTSIKLRFCLWFTICNYWCCSTTSIVQSSSR